jgi:hypothetical protein
VKKKLIPHNFSKMGLTESQATLINEVEFGSILEFSYGSKQKPGEKGGWKTDPKPSLLVFNDDGSKYIEGLNVHYLSFYYVSTLLKLLVKYPGIDGLKFYNIVKSTAPGALSSGYRKYIRSSVKPKTIFKVEG